ncbi:MAG: OmcA/MtrC family decaheme c-type cytochrome [Burkholderiales bacterium]|nr:MAG: OmcA/MtrC family decaheme c-type cytochrome [Burkholderiales bacterium]
MVNVSELPAEQWAALNMQGEVTSVTIASPPVVEFTVTDDKGKPVVGLEENTTTSNGVTQYSNVRFVLAKLVPGVSGSPAQWISYIVTSTSGAPSRPDTDRTGELVGHGDGTYTYTFDRDITTIKDQVDAAEVPAGSDKADLGDLTYDPDLQHRVVIQISGSQAGSSVRLENPVNVVYDFVPATGQPIAGGDLLKDVVDIASCNDCHGRLAIHGGGRVDTDYCVTCHTSQRAYGREKLLSVDGSFPAVTETATVDPVTGITSYRYAPSMYVGDGEVMGNFTTLIHKIHQGADLAKQNYNYAGLPFNLKHFSKLDGGQRMCSTCHDSELASQADHWNTAPSREACGACHDSVNFASGENHVGGAWTDDSTCAICHKPDGIKLVHRTENITDNNPTITDGLATFSYEIKSATVDGSGVLKVEFGIRQRISPSTEDALITLPPAGFTGGPSFLLAFAMAQDGITTPVDYNNLGNGQAKAQPRSVSLSSLLASGAVAPSGANPGYYVATINGAYPAGARMRSVSLQGYWTQVTPSGSVGRHAISVVKSVTGDAVRRRIVDPAKCGNCHEWFEGHGGNRVIGRQTQGEIVCVVCHVPGLATSGRGIADSDMQSYDWSDDDLQKLSEWGVDISAPNAALQLPVTSNNFKDMIHGIHAGRDRVTPFQDARDALRRAITLLDFRRMEFPGILSNCETCHLGGTSATTTYNVIPMNSLVSAHESINADYASAITAGTATPDLAKASLATANDTDVVRTPFAAACSSCHDNAAARGHMQSSGAVVGGTRLQALGAAESCSVCHGPGSEYDAAKVHR